ncbi:hypothetical protein CRENBAI_012869 [Crenichthys baileyi]|uniref:Fibronectin type-III domain-containing protein n=1 Tax=Crenichthys baileyi TaxID=28760 RepID=A0AAV9RCJ5_9TELE
MPLDDAFTALLLIICGVSSVAVPPPSNVTVSCQNVQTTVSWDYNEHQPHTIFQVNITGSNPVRSFVANTTDHQYDLSHFVWESQEHYQAFLCVIVTAIQGGKRSETVRSKSFSFNMLKPVDIKCMLDFPLVRVLVTEMGASVRFQNPLWFYNELKRTIKPDSVLKYTVSSAEEFEGSCHVTEANCKLDVTFRNGVEECVTLKGKVVLDSLGVNPIPFKETEKFCSEKTVEGVIVLAVTLGSIFVVILIVAVVVILKVKAWTMNTVTPPTYLMNLEGADSQQTFCTISANPEKISPVSIFKPYESTKHLQTSNVGCDHDHPARGPYEGRERFQRNLEAVGFISRANGTDEDSADDSVQTECVSISSTEEEISPYDSPHFVTMDMGAGEMVTGYTGN